MRIKLTVNKKALIAFVLYTVYSEPTYFQKCVPIIHALFQGLQVLCVFWLFLLVWNKKLKNCFWEYNIYLIIFYAVLFVMTLLRNRSGIIGVLQFSVPVVLFCQWVCVSDLPDVKKILNGCVFSTRLLIILNFLSVLLFPNGMFQGKSAGELYFFLGHNNSVIRVVLPGMIFSGVLDMLDNHKFSHRTYQMSLLAMATFVLTWSNSAMIGCGIFLLYILFCSRIKMQKLYNANLLFFLMIAFFVLVVVMNLGSSFLGSIAGLFGKTADLSGRVEIWQSGIIAFLQQPWTGYGYGKSIPVIANWTFDPSSYHNYFLDLAFRGGIGYVMMHLLIVKKCCGKLISQTNACNNFLIASMLIYFILWQVLPFGNQDTWAMMIVMQLCCQLNTDLTGNIDMRR